MINQLPPEFKSWFQFYMEIRNNIDLRGDLQINEFGYMSSHHTLLNNDCKFLIDRRFMKCKIFDELMLDIPDDLINSDLIGIMNYIISGLKNLDLDNKADFSQFLYDIFMNSKS